MIPKFEWIKRIVVEADYNGIPVFMKDRLVPIIGEKNMRRDYPKELQIRKRSEKVNKRLSGSCMLCGKTEDKNKMVTLTARAVRGGKAASFGHMCHSCFTKWLTAHNKPTCGKASVPKTGEGAKEFIAFLQLNKIPGIGAVTINKLIKVAEENGYL